MTLENNLDLWIEALQQQGFGKSEVQETLITVFSIATCPMSAEEIRVAMQHIRPETGTATVYRLIDKLSSLGLLRRVHGYRNCNTYVPSTNANHMLLICTDCGDVSYLKPDLFIQMMKSLASTVTELNKHHITTYHLQLLGTCTDCKTDQL